MLNIDITKLFRGTLILICTLSLSVSVWSQAEHNGLDSSFAARSLKLVDEQSRKVSDKFSAERLQLHQRRLFENIRHSIQDANNFLHSNLDTAHLRRQLNRYDEWERLFETELPPISPGLESYRNLGTLAKDMDGLHERVTIVRNRLYALHSTIVGLQYHLDSLTSDSVLHTLPRRDSAATNVYIKKLKGLIQEIVSVDSTLTGLAVHVEALLGRANNLLVRSSSQADLMHDRQMSLSSRVWLSEVPPLMTSANPDDLGVGEILEFSNVRTGLALLFYLQNNVPLLLVLFCGVAISSIYLFSLKKVLREEHLLHPKSEGQLVFRYPFLSSLIISISILQFVFPDPPVLFTMLCGGICAISLTIIFWGFIHRVWMRSWLLFLVIYILSCLINLLLLGTTDERWMMLSLSILGIGVSLLAVFNEREHLTERRLVYFVLLVMVMEILSVGANLWGRYNLAKNLFVTGYSSLIYAVIFLWTVRLINEGLATSFHVYTLKDRKLFSINFEKVGSRAPGILYALLTVGWVIMVFRNFYVYRLISEPLHQFVFEPRTIGEYSFSIASILTFILIMAVAAIVSQVVSFFGSDRPQTKNERGGLGSLLLLVRIGIFSLGLFLAFAAAGIPVDKVTIILGALSVGIGFGLQTLINNLVSGLILAFERPVNVGDIVEVNGQAGVMKSIGFRSSRISTWEGADVIMPNGDLLSGHLVNWTGGDTRRRMDMSIGVAYGSDLSKVERIIKEILHNEPLVIALPEPIVLFEEFGESSINLRILFWVSHFRERRQARSQVIVAIDTLFRQHQIVIPFPQRDVHVIREKDDDPVESDPGA